ncbi:MAG TPA: S9 family peptidase [Steroidobacteraceae bacterium]|nr:S9 family peptidase [Steroidobacteraceae bacterium]
MFRLVTSMLLALTSQAVPAQTTAPAPAATPAPPRPVSLDDLYSDLNIVDTAISPSGRYLALIVRRPTDDTLAVMDLQTNEKKALQRSKPGDLGKKLIMRISTVYWKSDERLLFRVTVRPEEDVVLTPAASSKIAKLGDRLFAINRDGSKLVAMLADNRNAALEGAFNLGAIRSFLIKDPNHILMELDGFNGRSLFKVNLDTGRGEQMERPSESVVGWWLDVEGAPVVRITAANGTIRLFRKDAEGKWKKFASMRIKEMKERPDFDPVGPSDQPGKHYVLASPPGKDRVGLYLYDIEKEQFGEPIIEHPNYDLSTARVSRDGKQVISHCHLAHVRVCSFADPKIEAHMKGLRKYFEESANLYTWDTSEDGKAILLYVEGPRDPPSYYFYQVEKKNIEIIGVERRALIDTARPKASAVSYLARDGKELSGYLTTPADSPAQGKLPLVLMPHGGPESRDSMSFDPWVQYLVARGYAVFQPNFRGSDGFGRKFAESGYGEWGRKMQDDLTDAVKALVNLGTADPARVCIVGASYGGYAALAGAALTPDLYKCAVSIAGISDLDDFISWRKRNWGSDSEGYTYWLKAIGDPGKDEQRLREVSPVTQADKIKIPVLLIHGTEDYVVPIAQSKAMKKALDKSGKKTELISLEEEGHSYWTAENEILAMTAIDNFLWQHLGPGFGISKAPNPRGAPSK